MGAGGLNGELRDNSNNYIDTVLQYHLNGLRERQSSGPYQQHYTFRTSANPTIFPSSSSSSTSNPSNPPLEDEVMVCYSCSTNFNLFKRKKNCSSCRRDFCKECFKEGIPSVDTTVTNCLICRSLKAPHVHREYLQKIKIKDLCDFLQKKNISFQDCKEKQELICLVLQSTPGAPQPVGVRRPPPTQPSTAWSNRRTSSNSSERSSTSTHSGNTSSTSRTTVPTTSNVTTNSSGSASSSTQKNAIMRTIDDVKTVDQIYNLSVKELKRILITNCVDFKGCCEKNELLEKVSLLWNDRNEAKKKNTDDQEEEKICKVCMDDVIDCVLLECGHMVTCMACSKKITECPICRQHISRIVKVFKA